MDRISALVDLGLKVKSGTAARLIPVGRGASQEYTSVNVFLACLQVVEGYQRDVLSTAGARVSKTSSVSCFTEVAAAELGHP